MYIYICVFVYTHTYAINKYSIYCNKKCNKNIKIKIM